MLPDFRRARETARKILKDFYDFEIKRMMGVVGKVKSVPLYEGDRMEFRRADGSEESLGMETFTSEVRLSKDEYERNGLGTVLKALVKTAKDSAHQRQEFFFRRFKETMEGSGQVSDARGQQFTCEVFLDALGKVDIDFDECGEPDLPDLVADPRLLAKVQEWMGSDEFRKRLDELIEGKRLAWRDRESDRRLVG